MVGATAIDGDEGTYLSSLRPESIDQDVSIVDEGVGIASSGLQYSHYLYSKVPGSKVEYRLGKKYHYLSGGWCMCYEDKDDQTWNSFTVFADGKKVYASPSLTGGDEPVEVFIDINYCDILSIEFTEGVGAGEFYEAVLY